MRILVTAGPTREPIDPVRFISNRSSGKMGYAVARAAAQRGHEVRLVSGPVALPAPDGVALTRVTTAQEMLAAVAAQTPWCEALVMAAAVADWRPAGVSAVKLKKRAAPLRLELEPTPDILREIAPLKGRRLYVGFCAESGDPRPEARRKRAAKGLDLIVANDISRADAGFEVDTNQVWFIAADGTERELPLLSKEAVGREIVLWIESFRR